MRLWRYFSDRERYAVLNIGIQEKAILTQGKAPDTAIGVAIRLMAQFKSFIAASMVRTAGREIYGQSGYGRISGIVQFVAAATVMGTAAEMLRQIAKNEDPTASFYGDPGTYLVKGASRGGALSVMGDFLFGEFSRHGQRPTGWLAGPTGGAIDDLLSIWAQGTRGENVDQSALYLARNNLPLQNLFWTKAAFDAFVWAEIMEWANPGYTSRMKRRQRREGIEPWLGN